MEDGIRSRDHPAPAQLSGGAALAWWLGGLHPESPAEAESRSECVSARTQGVSTRADVISAHARGGRGDGDARSPRGAISARLLIRGAIRASQRAGAPSGPRLQQLQAAEQRGEGGDAPGSPRRREEADKRGMEGGRGEGEATR